MNPTYDEQVANINSVKTTSQADKNLAISFLQKPTTINSNNLTPVNNYKLPNSTPIDNSGLQNEIMGAISYQKNQATAQDKLAETTSMRDDLYKQLIGANNEEANVNNIDRTKENEARALADSYTSQIEDEQRRLDKFERDILRNNPTGALRGGQADLLANAKRASLSKQADLALLQSAASRDYGRLNSIAEQQVQNNLAQIKAKQENLKLFIGQLDKDEARQYASIEKQVDREYEEKKKLEESIKAVKLEAVKNGAGSNVLNALSNAKTFDEALKSAGSYLATSQNEFRELENGNTVLVNKKTGQVIANIGGGKAPSVVARTVNGKPVTGYTMVAGDDPYFIAQQNGTTVDELKKLNPNIKDWNNIPVGATLNIPQTPEEAFLTYLKGTEGGKPLTDTSIQKLDKGLTVLGQLGTLQKNIEGVKTGPLIGKFKGANPWDTNAQTIKASLNAIVPNLARGVYGEVGVLTDNDIKTYAKTLPNLTSTEELRNAVLYITLDMIGKSIKNTLSVNAAAGRDVSGFTDIYTEMEATKNSILSQIPNAQVPQAFKKESDDDFLSQFTPEGVSSFISNNDFFNKL